jgi:DNA excision repair protein ERCC-2
LRDYIYKAEHWLARNEPASFREALLDLYFSVSGFLKIFDQFDESYTTCFEKVGTDLRIKLFCMNPAEHLKEALTRCDTVIFFSATLAPSNYFLHLLGCSESAGLLTLASPFPEKNLCLLIAGRISTRYHHRKNSLSSVVDAICALVSQKTGNYLLFFPSYAYLEQVHVALSPRLPETEILLQTPNMTENDRELFLDRFSHPGEKTLLGLVVMGGIFGEGIDLVGERLSGAVVVGVGLPGISFENELIRDYFSRTNEKGFEYAYMYPGINRVLQAAGRVIRSGSDRGGVLLIDERFDSARYRSLLPGHWHPVQVQDSGQIESAIATFWNEGITLQKG